MRYMAAASQMLDQIGERLRRRFGLHQGPEARILIVRGSRMAGEMARILRRYRLDIELVERTALLEHARRAQPALIVSDLAVSGMSEMEDALRLRRQLPDCKVMLFSGQGLRRTTLPRESELELVRTIERLCNDPFSGQMLWLDLARFIQAMPRHSSMAA
jgi:CheY-like chemotaxis protein